MVASSIRIGALLLSLLGAVNLQAACLQSELKVQGSEVAAGAFTLNLGEADDAASPAAWQGPLSTGKCETALSIIEPPLVLVNERLLFVPTYSGSMRRLSVVDLPACKIAWQSAPFSGKLKISPLELRLGKKRIPLAADCLPKAAK